MAGNRRGKPAGKKKAGRTTATKAAATLADRQAYNRTHGGSSAKARRNRAAVKKETSARGGKTFMAYARKFGLTSR